MAKIPKLFLSSLLLRQPPIRTALMMPLAFGAMTWVAILHKADLPPWLPFMLPVATLIFTAKLIVVCVKSAIQFMLSRYQNQPGSVARLVRILFGDFTVDWNAVKLLIAALWVGAVPAVIFVLWLLCKIPGLDSIFQLSVAVAGWFMARFAHLAAGKARTALRMLEINSQAPRNEKVRAQIVLLICGAFTVFGALVSYAFLFGVLRGRQLRRHSRPIVPPLIQCSSLGHLSPTLEVDPEKRDVLAARWRHNGLTEHASVAAFSRLALQLMAVDAPPRLVEFAHRDALDEIRHTHLCFSLAQAIDGQQVRPGGLTAPARSRPLTRLRLFALANLAIESLVEGALLEGVSARVITALAGRSTIPKIRTVLTGLAADEFRHAAHGWEVVEWCLHEGGLPVLCALRAAMRKWPESLSGHLSLGAVDSSWEDLGIPSHALEQNEYSRVRLDLIRLVESFTFTGNEPSVSQSAEVS